MMKPVDSSMYDATIDLTEKELSVSFEVGITFGIIHWVVILVRHQ